MIKFVFAPTFLLLLLIAPVLVFAQEQNPEGLSDAEVIEQSKPVIKDSTGLQLELIRHTQNPETKEIRFDIVIYSQITSDRVQVEWSVTGQTELITPTNSVVYSMSPGSVKRKSIVVRPRNFGISNLSITVEAFEAEGTFLSTAFQRIYSFADGTSLPITGEYQTLEVIGFIKTVAIILLFIFGGIFIFRVGFQVFQNWLHKPENLTIH